jgi:hypothetical protein
MAANTTRRGDMIQMPLVVNPDPHEVDLQIADPLQLRQHHHQPADSRARQPTVTGPQQRRCQKPAQQREADTVHPGLPRHRGAPNNISSISARVNRLGSTQRASSISIISIIGRASAGLASPSSIASPAPHHVHEARIVAGTQADAKPRQRKNC